MKKQRGATPIRNTPDWPTTWTGRLGLIASSLAGASVILGLIYGLIVVLSLAAEVS